MNECAEIFKLISDHTSADVFESVSLSVHLLLAASLRRVWSSTQHADKCVCQTRIKATIFANKHLCLYPEGKIKIKTYNQCWSAVIALRCISAQLRKGFIKEE